MEFDVFLSSPVRNCASADLVVESNRSFLWTLCFLATENCSCLVLEAYCQPNYVVPSFRSTMPPTYTYDNRSLKWETGDVIIRGFADIEFCIHFGILKQRMVGFVISKKGNLCVALIALAGDHVFIRVECRFVSLIQIPFLREKMKDLWLSKSTDPHFWL